MQKYLNSVADGTGRPVVGASVEVLDYPSGASAVIYSDNGVTLAANPLTTDANGAFSFYAADGRYSLSITGTSITPQVITDILLEDVTDGGSSPTFAAITVTGTSNSIGYKQGSTGSVPRTVEAKLQESVSVEDMTGCDPSGVSKSTSAFQYALDNAQRTADSYSGIYGTSVFEILLPAGVFRIDPLTITRPVKFRGMGKQNTTVVLVSGSTAPAFSVECVYDTVDYWSTTGKPAYVSFEHLTLTSESATDPSGQNVAHGIYLANAATNPVYTWLNLVDVDIYGMPADGLHGSSWNGALNGRGCTFKYNNGAGGITALSCADWRFSFCDVGGSTANLNLSGLGTSSFDHCNFYVPTNNNLNAYGLSLLEFSNCYFDLAGEDSINANLLAANGIQPYIRLKGCHVRYPSASVNNVYSGISCPAGSNGLIQIAASTFLTSSNPYSPGYTSKWDIYVDSASTATVVFDPTTVFDRGFPSVGNKVINGSSRIVGIYGSASSSASGTGMQMVGALADPNYSAPSPASGATESAAQGQTAMILVPSGSLASLTVNLPPNCIDGQTFEISSSQAITSLNVVPTAPATNVFNNSISLAAGQGVKYKYTAGGTSWVKVI